MHYIKSAIVSVVIFQLKIGSEDSNQAAMEVGDFHKFTELQL